MNKQEAEGKWMQFKGKMKETWGKLTDDDLDLYNGKKDQFFGKLKEQYGIAQQEAEEHIKKMEKECGDSCGCPSKNQDVA